jgi:hypothetical protein
VTVGSYLAGLAAFVATWGSAAVIATVIARRLLGHLRGSALVLAWLVLFEVALTAIVVIPLAAGTLARASVALVGVVFAIAAVVAVPRREDVEREATRPGGNGERRTIVVAVLAVCGVVGSIVAIWSTQTHVPPQGTDILTWDLPMVARWIRDHSFWQANEFVALNGHGAYPHGGLAILAAAIVPWKADGLVRSLEVAAALTMIPAVYALARELGASRAHSALLGAAVAILPAALRPALVAGMPDVLQAAPLAAGALFLARHARTRSSADLVIAGLALGLTFGMKWYGVSTVAVLLAVWGVAWLVARRGWRRLAGDGVVVLGLVLAVGGIWLVRNLVAYDDPLYPVRVPGLFDAPPDPTRQFYGATIASYLTNTDALRHDILPALWRDVGLVAIVALVGAVATAVAALRGGVSRVRDATTAAQVAIGIAALLIVVVYAITPYSALGPPGHPALVSANTRYVVPAIALAAAVTAMGLTRASRRVAMTGEVLVLAAIALSLHYGPRPPGVRTVVAFVGLAGVAAVILRRDALSRLGGGRPRLVAGVAVAVLVVAGSVTGLALQRRALSPRYARDDATFAFLQAAPALRVGIVGAWSDAGPPPVYPAGGPRMRHRVAYIGAIVRGQLERARSADEFRRELNRKQSDVLLVGKLPTHELTWARSLRWKVVAHGRRFTLFARPR